MATGGKLEVQIGVDKSDFDKKIKEVEFDIKELSKIKLDRLKVGLDTTEINAQIKDAKNSLNAFKTAVKDTGESVGGFTPKVANGGNALMQFSRIAQDAPYGIMGIGNNITATAEAFSYLQKETGSTGGALKALGSSLLGTGGLLLGVSLLTTGLTLMAQSGLSVGDVIDKITGKFDEFGRAVKKANEDAVKNSATEISGMNALVSAAGNVTLSMKDRLIAVDELQKQYPAYFGNLSKEQILNGNVETAVKGVTDALIAKAKAQAYTAELVKLSEEEFKLEEERNRLIEKQIGLRNSLERKQFGSRGLSPAQVEAALESALTATTSALDENQRKLTDNAIAQQKWNEKINESVAASIKLQATAFKTPKVFNTPQVSNISPLGIPAPLFDDGQIAVFNGQVDGFGNKIKELPDTIRASVIEATTAANAQLVIFNATWAKFGEDFSSILENGIETALTDFGTALGNSLVNGLNILDEVGAALLNSIGTTIKAVGTELVKMGVLAQAYAAVVQWMKKVFTNPFALAAAGVALVAIGAAISASAGRVANGGGGGASSSSGSGANNQSFSSSGFTQNAGGGTVVFEISGQKLIGVLSNTINGNKRLGGAIGL